MNDQEPTAPSASIDNNPDQPTPDQMYLAERLDENLTPAAVVNLNKAHGRVNVLEAMRQLHGFPPEDPVENVYAWVDTVASFKAAGK